MITAVIGGQYGSEGKGKVVQYLSPDYDIFVRVGGPNAGHVVYYNPLEKTGKSSENGCVKFTMRSVPCGWINFNATLIIGAGAVLNIELLEEELTELSKYDPLIRKRLYIDNNAMIINDIHIKEESKIMDTIGSTGQGVGNARIERIKRTARLAKDYPELEPYLADTVQMLYYNRGKNILLEGTQGSGLSMIHGEYPYTTSHDTNVSQLLADVGLPPSAIDNIIMVIRTYPIRVGGNSGPLHKEVSFDTLKSRIGPVTEYTSVTKKMRRIGMFDMNQIEKTARLNNPTHFALMFADYLDKDNYGVTEFENLSQDVLRLTKSIITATDAIPMFISTGPHTMVDLRDIYE